MKKMRRIQPNDDGNFFRANGERIGVLGQSDTPLLSKREMQLAVEGVAREVIIPAINDNVAAFEAFEEANEAALSAKATKEELANEIAAETIARETAITAEREARIAGDGALQAGLNAHVSRTNNPHGVTTAQIGAATVAQHNALTNQFNTHNADNVRHITAQEREHWNSGIGVDEELRNNTVTIANSAGGAAIGRGAFASEGYGEPVTIPLYANQTLLQQFTSSNIEAYADKADGIVTLRGHFSLFPFEGIANTMADFNGLLTICSLPPSFRPAQSTSFTVPLSGNASEGDEFVFFDVDVGVLVDAVSGDVRLNVNDVPLWGNEERSGMVLHTGGDGLSAITFPSADVPALENIDAIQLGEGHNVYDRTLQVYDYTLMNADGTIPIERIPQVGELSASIGQISTAIAAILGG